MAILTIFWAVFKGGWKVILFPTEIEDRGKGAKLDWYEVLALPLGLLVVFFASIVDNSALANIPSVVFQSGLLIGGLLHFVMNKEDRDQMLGTLFILVSAAVLFYLFSIPVQWFSDSWWGISISILVAVLLLILVYIPINYSFLHTKPSIFALLGRPAKDAIQKPTRLWDWISRVAVFDPNRPGLLTRLQSENIFNSERKDMMRIFDLGSLVILLELYIILPLLLIRIVLFHPLLWLLVFVLGLLLWVMRGDGLPRDLSRSIDVLGEFNILKRYSIIWEDITWENGEITKLDLSYRSIETLLENLFKLTKLTYLNIGSNELTSLPESLIELTSLTSLSIDNNNFTSLPENLFKLTNLQKHQFTHCS